MIRAINGGWDSGAVRADIKEKDLVLDIGRRICAMSTLAGQMKAVMTRYSDGYLGLKSRCQAEQWIRANICENAVFVSLHVNSTSKDETTATGVACFHHHTSTNGRALAKSIQEEILESTTLDRYTDEDLEYNEGVLSDKEFLGHALTVLKHTQSPAVLVEMGFINNEKNRLVLCDPMVRSYIATAIWDGVEAYFSEG